MKQVMVAEHMCVCVCVCECCAGNVQFVASTGWREKFIRRHPEVRTKVTEVGEYFVGTVMCICKSSYNSM